MANTIRGCPRRAVYMLLPEDLVADLERNALRERRSRNNYIEVALAEKVYGKPQHSEERVAA
jgi:hypothetical protein